MTRHQNPLRGIGHGFAHAEDSPVVGRNEPIAFSEEGGNSQAGDSCGGDQASCNQLSPGEHAAHEGSFLATLWPVIMARTRLVKPARQTMAMCTRRKRTRKFAMKKWIVRADCCPWRTVTRMGKTEVTEGDMARPVQIINGKNRKTTVR